LENNAGMYQDEKKRLEKQIGDLKTKLLGSETQIGKLQEIKKQNMDLLKEKVKGKEKEQMELNQ
jgi:hypothetical protein